MNYKNQVRIILAFCISIYLIACKDKGAGEETVKTDTTKMNTENVSAMDQTPDAPTAASALYKVLADSMGIRILEVNYNPGDSSALHSHPDLAAITISGGSLTFYGKDGAAMTNELPTGATLIRPSEVHSVKNSGNTTVKVVLVEVKRPGAMTSSDASTDAAKVSPALYKVKSDSLGIRVIEVNYKPGQSSPMHSHPDNALYVLDEGTGEFTDKNGNKTTVTFKKGMTAIRPAESHSVKNVGKTTLKAILVEVNRQ